MHLVSSAINHLDEEVSKCKFVENSAFNFQSTLSIVFTASKETIVFFILLFNRRYNQVVDSVFKALTVVGCVSTHSELCLI